ncbi:hypothetical protein K469DRAFT_578865 [Zopfia rhizophila CBS 207.26]|uniref:Uncharacterized protein n=1 Tax=Zopfia rhizophila CBS 207.26 TaxID=1314779 RepID=A0A6A6E0Y8_9PEZI|nr:hypothetical protein K469DRAFT_578865 [Zopfia rhizophila CBS 207.26]
MCGQKNFKGDCYYGYYPILKAIHPDKYWVKRISSAEPDRGGNCIFLGYNPGGNLAPAINDKMGCFYSNPNR